TGTGTAGSGTTGTWTTGSGTAGSGTTSTGTVMPAANTLYAVSPIDGNAGGPITVSAIDEGTGVATPVAQIAGVSSWSPALFVDQTNTHAYAFAANAGGTSVYT